MALFHDFCLVSIDNWDARSPLATRSKLARRWLRICGTENTKNVGVSCLSMMAVSLGPRSLNGCKFTVRAAAIMRRSAGRTATLGLRREHLHTAHTTNCLMKREQKAGTAAARRRREAILQRGMQNVSVPGKAVQEEVTMGSADAMLWYLHGGSW